jgi:hypothetical protein
MGQAPQLGGFLHESVRFDHRSGSQIVDSMGRQRTGTADVPAQVRIADGGTLWRSDPERRDVTKVADSRFRPRMIRFEA